MTVTAGNIFKGFVWSVVGALLIAVFLYPLGGEGGLAGMSFMVNNAIVIFVLALILYFYPTQTTPVFKRFLGFRGIESTAIFVIAIEAAGIGLFILYWLVGAVIGFLGWWTNSVGVELAAAHFLVSSGILGTAYIRSRRFADPGSWYIAPIVTVLVLLLVPLAYRGILFQ